MATVLEVQEQVSVSAPLALALAASPDSGFPDLRPGPAPGLRAQGSFADRPEFC